MYYFWESGIKKTNCENLIKTYAPLATINSATVSEDGNQESNPNIRKQKVCWVESDEVIVRDVQEILISPVCCASTGINGGTKSMLTSKIPKNA